MITTIDQAIEVQKRRVAAGKRGYAKAVRRHLLREAGDKYQDLKRALPVGWPFKKKAA